MANTQQTTFATDEQRQNNQDAATVTPAGDAAGCGAIGCATGGDLLQIETHTGARRVLCPRHAGEYLGREVLQ